jgi:hypothetical protein
MTTTKIARLTGSNVIALDNMSALDLIPMPADETAKTSRTYAAMPAELRAMIERGRTANGVDDFTVRSSHAVTRKLEDWCSTVGATAGRTDPDDKTTRTVGHVTVTFE